MLRRTLVALAFVFFTASVCPAFDIDPVVVVAVTEDTITIARTAKEGAMTFKAAPWWVKDGPPFPNDTNLRFQDVRVGMRVTLRWHLEDGVPTCTAVGLSRNIPQIPR
jgi:hypothetical protein